MKDKAKDRNVEANFLLLDKKYLTLLKKIGLSTFEELIDISVRNLNKLTQKLDARDVSQIKSLRRTFKNRGYAANCRERRLSQREQLELEQKELKEELNELNNKNEQLIKELEQLKKMTNLLKKVDEGKETVRLGLQFVPSVSSDELNIDNSFDIF